LLWRSNGGLTNARPTPPSRGALKAKKKTKDAPPRCAVWIAPRSKKQCADKYFRSEATRERSSLYLAVLIGRVFCNFLPIVDDLLCYDTAL